ncbi:MAG: DNA primase [Myxococcales bacterium]|nr:DNA primase [Myxococcales bacterium]MCB9519795.1 DNA primase [Myxococcales bacterium]
MGSRIPENIVEDVIARASIVDVVGEHVRLKRRGARLLGLCPFHNEKSPSFSVNAERNLYHCFGCGASGNVVGFLMRHDGLSFPEAVRRLADKVGVTIPETAGEDPRVAAGRKAAREQYFEVTERAREYYRGLMTSGRHAPPRDYLAKRGIDDATAEAFGLGYASTEWAGLVEALGRAGIDSAAIEAAGLALRRRTGDGFVDRFRDRVMFPIASLSRQTLAFSGRTLDPEERAKYVNSPETPFYTKGRELFGLHLAHRAVRETGELILVEGNFDVVSLYARGVCNVSAPLGTALTEHQARLIKRYTDRVVLMFDGDRAGRAAARRALDVLLAADISEIVWARLPDGRDPDDLARTEGADGVRRCVAEARPMLDICLDEVIRPAAGGADIGVKRAALDGVTELLRPVQNALIQEQYVTSAAQRLQVDAAALLRQVRSRPAGVRRDAEPPPPESDEPPPWGDDEVERASEEEPEAPLDPLDAHEATLVELLADDDALVDEVYRERLHFVIRHPALREFVERVVSSRVEDGGPSLRAAVERESSAALRSLLTAVLVEDRGIDPHARHAAFEETVRSLKLRWARAEKLRLAAALQVERDFDATLARMEEARRIDALLAELQGVTRRPVSGQEMS